MYSTAKEIRVCSWIDYPYTIERVARTSFVTIAEFKCEIIHRWRSATRIPSLVSIIAHDTWINQMSSVRTGSVLHSPTHSTLPQRHSYSVAYSCKLHIEPCRRAKLLKRRVWPGLSRPPGFRNGVVMLTVSTSLYELYLPSTILQFCQATAAVVVAILLLLIEKTLPNFRFRLICVSAKMLGDPLQCGARFYPSFYAKF